MARRTRGFSLLEVLLAIAIVGGGIITLLLIRSEAIQMAGEAIRLRSTRLLLADQAGHALAVGLSTSLEARDPGEGFESFRVERIVEEVAFEELVPEEVVERPADPSEPGAPGSGSEPAAAGEGGGGLLIRRLIVVVYPPGADEDPTLAVTVVTYQLDEPRGDAGGTAGSGSGTGSAANEQKFPEQLPPLVGPDAVGPPGTNTGSGGEGGANNGEGGGENPPAPPSGG
ncbi:MAG: type IV pilus modification PilV family protein [Planctomycetota bacterium]|jgi:prepilin-type N-terminal cleavage/methylation domain-containing protein